MLKFINGVFTCTACGETLSGAEVERAIKSIESFDRNQKISGFCPCCGNEYQKLIVKERYVYIVVNDVADDFFIVGVYENEDDANREAEKDEFLDVRKFVVQ